MRPRALLIVSTAAIAVAFAATAWAGWIVPGSGTSYGKALALGAGNTPTASVSNRTVTVSWTAPSGGAPPAGYLVKRYDTSNNLQTIGSACTGTIAALTCTENALPNGSWKYTVTPAKGNWRGAESAQSATATVVGPNIGTSVIAKSQGGHGGTIKQGGTYFVYGNAVGSGNPPAGLSTLTADVSSVTTGQTAVPLVNGSFTVDGVSYNYRSAQLTANASLSAGSKAYSLSLTDTAGSSSSSNFSVTVDNTVPFASDIQTANHNTIVGQAQITDTITYTFSEPVEPFSILAGWDGTSTPVVVRVTHGLLALGNDGAEIYNSANSSVLPYGQVDLGRNDYVNGILGGRLDFGASGTASTMVMSGNSVTVTLGTRTTVGALVTAGTAGGTGTMVWNPVATPYDWAANVMSTATVNQSGGPAKEF
jgi:hypothetical protein